MDDVCGELGYAPDAWLPGQTQANNIGGRVLHAPGAAYTWSCGKGGPTLSRDDVTKGCQMFKPGTKAYTYDPNYAYSWVCM